MKRQLECHPDLTRFAYESMTCKDKLRRYEEYSQGMDQYDATIAKHRKYEELLAERLAKAEHELKLFRQGLVSHSPTADDIPAQDIAESSQCLSLSDKSHDDFKGLQSELAKIMHEKIDLEARYDDLALEQDVLRKEFKDLQESSDALNGESLSNGIGNDRKRKRDSDDMNASLKELRTLQQGLNARIASLEEENSQLRRTRDQLLEDARVNFQTACDTKQELLDMKNRHEKILREKEEQLIDLNGKLELASNSRDGLHSEREALLREIANRKESLSEMDKRFQVASVVLDDAKCEIAENHHKITELESNVVKLGDKLRQYDPLQSFGASTEEIVRRIQKGDQNQSRMQQCIGKLEFALQTAQHDNEDLLVQIKELQDSADRERLATAEATIQSLGAEMEALQEELLTLRRENDKLIQHTNVKQKLQYHLQIKEENNHFREDIRQLREELTRLNQRNSELEDMLSSLNTGAKTSHSHHVYPGK